MEGECVSPIDAGLQRLHEMTYEEVCAFQETFNAYYKKVRETLRNPGPHMSVYSDFPLPCGQLDVERKSIEMRKRELLSSMEPFAKRYYDNRIRLSSEEVVNGYALLNIVFDFDYEYFGELRKRVETKRNKTNEEFLQWLETNCCTDWRKKDPNGETYVGRYWTAPEGSYERENAGDLTQAHNFEEMLKLPFHREILQVSVMQGCNSRRECVRFSNCFGVWFERMLAIVKAE